MMKEEQKMLTIALRVGVSTWHRSAIMLSLLHAGKKKITKKRKM